MNSWAHKGSKPQVKIVTFSNAQFLWLIPSKVWSRPQTSSLCRCKIVLQRQPYYCLTHILNECTQKSFHKVRIRLMGWMVSNSRHLLSKYQLPRYQEKARLDNGKGKNMQFVGAHSCIFEVYGSKWWSISWLWSCCKIALRSASYWHTSLHGPSQVQQFLFFLRALDSFVTFIIC